MVGGGAEDVSSVRSLLEKGDSSFRRLLLRGHFNELVTCSSGSSQQRAIVQRRVRPRSERWTTRRTRSNAKKSDAVDPSRQAVREQGDGRLDHSGPWTPTVSTRNLADPEGSTLENLGARPPPTRPLSHPFLFRAVCQSVMSLPRRDFQFISFVFSGSSERFLVLFFCK